MQLSTMVQVRITIGPEQFSDALYYAPDDYAAMTQEQVSAAARARYDAWQSALAEAAMRPAPPFEPTFSVQCEDGETLEV